jgi:hypothetical protein
LGDGGGNLKGVYRTLILGLRREPRPSKKYEERIELPGEPDLLLIAAGMKPFERKEEIPVAHIS